MSASQELLDSIRGLAADVLGVSASALTAASGPDTVEAWDSVAHLNLVMAAEEQFGVSLDPSEIEGVHSLGELAGVIAKHRQ